MTTKTCEPTNRNYSRPERLATSFLASALTVLLLCLCLGLAAAQAAAAPATVWVDDDYTAAGANDGHTWAVDAFATLQGGVDAVADGGTVNIAPGTYKGAKSSKSVNVNATGPGVNIKGASPAWTQSGGTVSFNGQSFTVATDDPTILVTGGTLTMSNCTIDESTGFDQVAFKVTGGTLVLSSGNTVNINGAGSFIRNEGANPIAAAGNTWKQDGTPVTDNFAIEDKIFHALDSSASGLVTWVANNVYVTASSGSVQRGIAAASAGFTVNVGPGTFTENGQIAIAKNLSIIGAGIGSTTLKTDTSTTAGGNVPSEAWVYLAPSTSLKLASLTLDGTGYQVHHAVQSRGTLTMVSCEVKNIKYADYLGRGVVLYTGTAGITNVTMSNIERIGVHVRGGVVTPAPTAIIDTLTYTGKGPGTWLDYGVEIGAGGAAEIYNSTITACTGVASDGSTSAGVMATTYFGAGTTAKLIGNTITGNTDGVMVGYDSADTSAVLLQANNLTGNLNAGINMTGGTVDAGQIGGTDITGLGISTGGNNPTGYGPDNTAPWAILNSGTGTVMAFNNNYGTFANVKDLLSGTVGGYSQSGSLYLSCPPAVTVQCVGGVPAAATDLAGFVAQGGVASASVMASLSSADVPPTPPIDGSITRTYSLTDVGGNSATCTQTITVHDTTAPTITAPANVTVNVDPGACQATGVALGTPVTGDNCAVAGEVNDHPSSTFPVGATTVTWTVTDSSGLTATAQQTVTVNDNEAPVVSCKPATVNLDSNGQGNISVADVKVSSSDNCGIATETLSQSAFTICDVGAKTVTLTVTDIHGNPATCDATVTVVAPIATPSVVYVDASYGASCAQVTFPAVGGTGQYYVSYNAFNTIQAAVDAVADGGTVHVAPGTYAERVVVAKPNVTVEGAGTTSIVTGTTSLPAAGVTPAVFKIAASGVKISKFKILVDFAFNHSGVQSSGTCTGITVADNLIVASASATPAFGYGLRNAIAINPNINVVGYTLDNVGYTGVSVTGNTIEPTGSTFFRAGIQMDLCAGSIIGNTSTAINHDFISRFANQGAITVSSNAFYGGGAQVGSFNGGAGAVTIAYNLFDNSIMQPATGSIGTGASLRLIYYAEVPGANNPVTVSGNTFQNHRWAVSVEDYKNVVFDNNSFTPKAGSADYIHVTFNTKIIASTSAGTINMVPVGATLTRNTFNGSGTSGGTALAFYNHRSTDAVFGTYTLGTAGNENTFNAGIARFLQLDASTGASSSWVGFGEYAGVPSTTMAPWPVSLDAQNNYFDVGSGPALPSTMSLSDLFAVEDRIQHKLDNAALALVSVKALNVYVTTSSGSIQRGIDAAAAGDTVNVAAGTYTEGPQIVISKNLNVAGQDSATTIIQPAADTGNSGNARGWWLVESCYTFNLSGVTLDGNGKNVYQGIRNLGNGTISNVHFTGIGYPGYMGTAVAAMGSCGAVNVYDSRFDNIGRVGVIYFGAGTTGAYARNTYTGKGPGDWLDYGVEIGGGGVAAISDSVISACQGVASADGSTSASILATTYYGPGTSATVNNCLLSGNSTGIAVGYDGADTSAVVARNNDLSGNTSAGVSTTGPAVDAQYNWWGSPQGPTIAANAGGNGVATEAGVDFSPWLGLGTDTSASIGFQPNPAPIYYTPHHLVFSTQPGGAGAASLLAPQPVVEVIDENGGIAAQFGGSVSLAIGNNPSGGTLAGALTLPAAAGVATFSGLSIDRAGAAYTLAASSLAPIAGATSAAFDISNPLPGIVSLTPPWAVAGDPAFTLTVNGANFVYNSVVRWNGADRATTYISPTQLSIAVAAADIATAATANVTVFNTAPGGGESAPVAFEVKGVPSVVWVDDNYTSGGPNDGHLWGYDAFDKIQDGVNRVAASGTVNVGAGTYIENITIPKPLHLLGAGTGTIIYPAQLDVGQPNPDDGPAFRASQVIVVAANNVEIGRLTIDGDNPSNGAGVDARNGIIEGDPAPFSGLEVHHCVVKNIYLRAIYPRSAAASNGFYIHDNTVDNVQGGPSSVAIFNFGGSGIFSNNVVTAANDAISANHSAGTLFLDNRITNCASGVHTDNAGDGGGTADAIRGNIVVDETGAALSYGIWVFVPYLAPTVETNTVIGCGAGLGAFAQGAPVTTVFKNNLVDGQSLAAGTWGVYVSSTSFSWGEYNVAASFTGNFIRNNLVGCYIDAAAGKTLDLTASNNSFEGNTTAIQASAGTGTLNVNASGNWWGTTSDTAIAALVPATADFTPYLHSGTDVGGNPADGFQGDFSALHVSALGMQTGSTGRIQEGIDLASAGTLYVQAGTYVEAAQVLVNKDLSIIGAAAATTIIKPAADTGASDDSKGWFLVGDGRTVNFQQATFDGTGRKVYQAIRHKGTGAIADCVFANIQYEASGPAYQGTAIGIHTTGNVDVTGCSFSGIGRNGVAAYDTYVDLPPTGPTGTYSGNTYTGKGAGNWLDYAFLVQGGAHVNINNNQISDCVGVATVDGSGSCGVAIWDDAGTAAALAGNTLANNTAGIALALWTGGGTDPQVTIGAGNIFIGGEVGVDIQNVSGAFLAASPAVAIGASTFQGQTDQAIRFQPPISAGASFDISSAIFKTSGGVAVTDNFDKEDLVYHALDAADEGLLVWNANNVYVTPLSASIQRGVNAAGAGWTVNVKAGAYTENVNVNKPVAVSPGASPAQVTLNGNLALSAGSSLVFELNGLTPGANYDQLVVNGTVNLGGATLTATSGFSYPPGSTVVLVANDGTDPVVGTFAGLANGATVNVGGQDFTIFYNGGDGNDVVLFRSGSLGTFATVHVNNNFANPVPGQDPDGAGPAHYYLYDSFPTIQQGVDAVQAGGTVQVAAGTYSESQVLIAQACTVQGQGAATTIIDAGCGTGLSAPGTVRITAPGSVTFDGFTVKNPKAESVSGKNTRVGIFASSPAVGDVYTIEHNIILGCNNPADTEDYGFYAYGGLGTVVFRTNEIHLVSANPILIERHPGATEVSYSTFDRGVGNFSNDAYFNMNYGGATVTSLQKVHHNTIDMGNDAGPFDNDHRGMGITFAGSFNGTEAGGYSQVVVTENQITNLKAYRRGIGLWNNAPDGNAAWGDITGSVIERNTLSGPATVEAGSIGVRLLGQVSGAGIRNNAISSVEKGIQARNWNTSVASDTVIFNNSFAGNTTTLENQGGTALDASGNWWGANTEAGVASSLLGPADCTPWLDVGTDLGAAAGFQGDFSFLHVSAACLQTAGGRIQEAINLLADGALTGSDRKVDVLAGYYLENVVVNKAVSVLGPNAGVAATGTRVAEAVVRSAINDPDGNQPIISIEHSNVRIDGLKLDGASGLPGGQLVGGVDVNGGVGIQNGNYASLVDVDHVTIENNIFRNHTYQGVYIWNTYGLNSSGNYIRNNSFDNMWEGVQLYAMHARITDNLFGNVRRGLSVHQVNTAPDAGFEPVIAGNTVNVAGNLNVYTDGGTYGTGIWVNGRKQDAPALVVSGNTVNAPNPMPTGKIFVGLRIWDVEDAAQLTFQNNQVNGNGAGQIGVNAWLVTGTQPPVITGGAISGVTVAGAEAQTYDADPDWGGHHDVALIVDAVPMTLSPEAVGVRAVVDPADPTKKAVITVRNSTAISGGVAGVQVSGANASAKIIDNPASITGNTVGVDVDAGKAMLQNNNLAGNTLAAIRASNGAIVDAGQCGTGGTDVTGLGISTGGNVLSGYGFDGAVPWAILNLNSGTPSVLACNDDFGAAAGQSIAQVVSGNVFYTQAGSLLASITPAVTVQCLGDVPAGALTEAGFLAAGGVASASPITVGFADGLLTPGPIEGTITRTYTITDGCGTSATCSQTITINDTTFPLITAPAPVTVPADAGVCGATGVALGTPVFSDNCGIAGVSNNAPGTFPVGTTTVTWTATDLHGNQSTAAQTVTVQDTQPPTLAAPANIVQAVDAGQTYATVAFTLPAATDNCGIASVVSDPASPHQFSVGTNVVSVVATDVNGNTSGTTFTVAVVALPSITTQPVSRTNYAGSLATFTVAATSPASLSYQWKKGGTPLSDGGNISGATTASLSIANVSEADAGLYTVEVSNLAGSVTSGPATLTVFNAPSIASQPQARTNNASTTATFTVVLAANSTPPLAYQWFKNGTNVLADAGNVSGATTDTLTLAKVLAADAGEYSVTISNEVGTATSTNALLTVIDPVILEQPLDVVAPLGSPVSFTVTAAGTAPLSYQWYQSGVELPGETAATLALSAIVDSDEGFYSVVVSNSIGSVASIPAALLITHPPVITVQPASQIANQGDIVIFDVSANGTVPFSYQWSKGGVPLPGETSRQLVLAGVSTASEGSYQVTITNVDGAATSAVATLTVIVPPVITLEPVGLTTNAGATAVFSVTVAGSPAAYSWFKNGTNLLSDGGKISGATSNILTLTDVLGADGGQYSFVASNRAGIALSSNAVLAVIDPIITTQPVGSTVNLGDPATLTVAAYGTTPAYQWRLNGAPINGATSATLHIANASAADAGNYDVVVSNQFGTVTSDLVVLAVIIPPHITVGPASLTRNAGQTAVFTVTVEGTAPFSYQWKKAGVDIEGATTDTLTLTGVSQADATTYTVYVSNPAGKDLSDPATLTVIDPPVIVAQPQSRTNNATTVASFAVTATGTAPAYQWLMDGKNLIDGGHISGATSAVLTLSNVLAADRGGYSVVLSNAAGAVTSSIAALVVVDPAIFTQPVSQTNVTGGSATFTVTAAGTPLLSYQWYQGATVLFGRTASSLTLSNLSSSDAGNYTVVVTGPGGSITSAPAYLATFPPLIVTQPVNQTVNQGQSASFSVSVNGLTPFTYQWQRDAGAGSWTNVPSATNRIYSVASAQAGDAGAYRVVVTNPVGSETSQPATLTVIIPPTITTQPASQTNVVSSTVTFTVGVNGTAPFAYQWKKGAADMANQTNATLVLAGITAADAATYSVVVTNPAGTATSLGASLTVVAQPALTILSCTNGKATLSLTAAAGYRYGIQASTNFVDWTSLVTNVAPYTFIDTDAGSFSQRYYRGFLVP